MDLIDPQGRRLYVTEGERAAFLDAASKTPRPVRTLCLTQPLIFHTVHYHTFF